VEEKEECQKEEEAKAHQSSLGFIVLWRIDTLLGRNSKRTAEQPLLLDNGRQTHQQYPGYR
jgi:hypothetical protein